LHQLIPHKEERFLFTVYPMFFVLLGAALAECAEGGIWSAARRDSSGSRTARR